MPELLRLAAFTRDPAGGNPAGVWIGDAHPDASEMLAIAADVGYSETAFLVPEPSDGPDAWRVRYFSAAAEVPFCGHATIAAGVALAERSGGTRFVLRTNDGPVIVETGADASGATRATLTSVPGRARDAEPGLVARALASLRWAASELDPSLRPGVGYAGADHLILAAGTAARLADLAYDFDALRALMLEHDLTTVQLIWRETPTLFRARDPFPVGNVVEDPATGAAAAALGAYLRWRGELVPPARFSIRQGVELGRPSDLEVEVPDAEGGIRVSGTAVAIQRGAV